jgi:hypothetical protein
MRKTGEARNAVGREGGIHEGVWLRRVEILPVGFTRELLSR